MWTQIQKKGNNNCIYDTRQPLGLETWSDFFMVAGKLNDELALLQTHLVTHLQPKSADHWLRISISYATPNDACSPLKQQHLHYKYIKEVWVFLCYYCKNYTVWKHGNAVMISFLTVILFSRKNENNCSGANQNTIVHWEVKRFT